MDKSDKIEFLKELLELNILIGIPHYNGGCLSVSPESIFKYYEVGHNKFWAEHLNVSSDNFESYLTQHCHCGSPCMAMTKKNKPCKNLSLVYDIYKFIEKRNNGELFCQLHEEMYTKDLE
jgi:hypothetical protein